MERYSKEHVHQKEFHPSRNRNMVKGITLTKKLHQIIAPMVFPGLKKIRRQQIHSLDQLSRFITIAKSSTPAIGASKPAQYMVQCSDYNPTSASRKLIVQIWLPPIKRSSRPRALYEMPCAERPY